MIAAALAVTMSGCGAHAPVTGNHYTSRDGKLDIKGVVDHAALKAIGLARGGKDGVRLLGKGDFTAKVKFSVTGASKGAIAAVEKAGGSVEVAAPKVSEDDKKAARRDANKSAAAGKKAASKAGAAE